MKLIAALLASVLLLAGCSGSSDDEKTSTPSPEASRSFDRDALDQQAKEQAEQAEQAAAAQQELAGEVDKKADALKRGTVVDIAITDGKVTPLGKRVEVGDSGVVTLQVTSDVAEEIHVHSDPEHTYRVPAGGSITETFTITTPGQVAVEAHELGATIVQLVVR